MVTVLTTCPFCPCGCGLYLQADNNTLIGSAPSEHHPVSRGKLCARGWHAHEAPLWGPRLTRPLVRRNGSLAETSWPEALAAAFGGLSGVLAAGGSVGVLGSARATNEENFLAVKLARGALQTGNLDSCLRASIEPALTGIGEVRDTAWLPGGLEDLEQSDAIILLEGDLAVTHPRIASVIMAAVKRGARLVTIGWKRTQMSRLAALHLSRRPGAVGETVRGLLAAVLTGSRDVASGGSASDTGFDELRASVADLGVSSDVRSAAEWYVGAPKASIVVAEGAVPPDQFRSESAALAMLAAVTGHLGTPGSAVLVLPSRGNLRGACEVGVRPDALPGGLPLGDTAGLATLRQLWGREPSGTAGLGAEAMLSACQGLVVLADDVPAALPDGRFAREALDRMDCLVVLDSYLTATARAARVVLPVAAFGETEGTTTSFEGRVQRVRECVSPPGEARPGWQALAELVTAFGLACTYHSAAEVRREMAGLLAPFGGVGDSLSDEGWGVLPRDPVDGSRVRLRGIARSGDGPGQGMFVGVYDGPFDWGSDPLVTYSPTLSRDHVARRKLFPNGFVEINKADAERLGVRQGWSVRIASDRGEVTVPVVLSRDLEPGVVCLPYSARDRVGAVLGGRGIAALRVERV